MIHDWLMHLLYEQSLSADELEELKLEVVSEVIVKITGEVSKQLIDIATLFS